MLPIRLIRVRNDYGKSTAKARLSGFPSFPAEHRDLRADGPPNAQNAH